jgi:hypothetical protein
LSAQTTSTKTMSTHSFFPLAIAASSRIAVTATIGALGNLCFASYALMRVDASKPETESATSEQFESDSAPFRTGMSISMSTGRENVRIQTKILRKKVLPRDGWKVLYFATPTPPSSASSYG